MKQVFKFDKEGFYVEPVILHINEEIPLDCTEIKPPDGLYKGKFVNGRWIESLSPEEIDAITNIPQPLTELEQLKKQQADLIFQLVMNGVL